MHLVLIWPLLEDRAEKCKKLRWSFGVGGESKISFRDLLTFSVYRLHGYIQKSYLGGFDGAWTFAKLSWFFSLPRIHSPSVTMVSVKMSAGMPTAIKIWQNLSKRRHCWIVFWQLVATCIHKGKKRNIFLRHALFAYKMVFFTQ